MRSIDVDEFTRSERRALLQAVTAVGAGAATCVALWLLLVPWDLSEFDARGGIIEGGGDDSAPLQGGVIAILLVVGLLLVAVAPRFGRIASIASFVTWAALWTWRVSVSRVSGANMWPVPFVVLVVPATVLASAMVIGLGRRRGRSVIKSP